MTNLLFKTAFPSALTVADYFYIACMKNTLTFLKPVNDYTVMADGWCQWLYYLPELGIDHPIDAEELREWESVRQFLFEVPRDQWETKFKKLTATIEVIERFLPWGRLDTTYLVKVEDEGYAICNDCNGFPLHSDLCASEKLLTLEQAQKEYDDYCFENS